MNHIPHQDRFQTSTGMLITPDGERRPVQINLYWSNHNPLAYVIGIRDVDANEQQAWEVARWLFLAADSRSANGALVGGGDFAIGSSNPHTSPARDGHRSPCPPRKCASSWTPRSRACTGTANRK
jgi:hypothetical protein